MQFNEFQAQVESVCTTLADHYTTTEGVFDVKGFSAALAELLQASDTRPLADLNMQWRKIEHAVQGE